MKKKKVKEIGITALYERLSRDDDGDGDSNSIVHQKQMLETYAKEHGFINLHHYTDDGWSGASFDRPAWNELVSGVKDGKITTVIVKDLSRVGRDHLQVGFFTDICNELFTWADVYDTANHDERRAILQQFIKEIRVRKDYEISITLNASFNQVEQLKAVSTYDGAEIFEGISERGA